MEMEGDEKGMWEGGNMMIRKGYVEEMLGGVRREGDDKGIWWARKEMRWKGDEEGKRGGGKLMWGKVRRR